MTAMVCVFDFAFDRENRWATVRLTDGGGQHPDWEGGVLELDVRAYDRGGVSLLTVILWQLSFFRVPVERVSEDGRHLDGFSFQAGGQSFSILKKGYDGYAGVFDSGGDVAGLDDVAGRLAVRKSL